MKYGLLTYTSINGTINIGDYIQSLAAKQFTGEFPIYVNREHLNSYQGEDICIILNGWFMHFPENFPPSNNIIPIFISFHINKSVKDILLTDASLKYLKRHEPIGCRDLYTRDILIRHGINAYFSGCLTLTLGNTYKQTEDRKHIYFVDPYLGRRRDIIANILSATKIFIFNRKKICKIAYLKYQKINISTAILASIFYSQYKRIWSDDILLNAIYIDHYVIPKEENDNFRYADELLKKYANAKLIITSRIHAALPATGMNTPCIFIKPIISDADKSRFPGLSDFLNTMTHTGTAIKNDRHINALNPEIKNNFFGYKKLLIENLSTKVKEIEKDK